ncbi:hypothetical protein ACGFY0_28800 [Streptomyces chartreusis]|uniref:hypothetical protein n=1 Tax=Streptomyces chartreusis TaxID=1969 RepID=UPI003723B02D
MWEHFQRQMEIATDAIQTADTITLISTTGFLMERLCAVDHSRSHIDHIGRCQDSEAGTVRAPSDQEHGPSLATSPQCD